MGSIYDISDYEVTSYTANDIIHCGNCSSPTSTPNGRFYYNLGNGNGARPEASGGETYWGGWTTFDNKAIPHFFWIPSYSPTISTEPAVRTLKFGDGYEQRSPDGINTNLLKISLNYDNRDEAEITAISHFLHQRGGSEAFAYLPPSPYSSMKKFVCRQWDVTMNFDNNYSIKVDLEEVVE
tara:strand:- start:2707 stop:3249 length:543 start_codon:yes stop_codon:yes gene_type:complete